MIQLVISIMAIALTGALIMASINYLPSWQKSASDADSQLRNALPLLEQAYDVVTRSAGGTPPTVLAGGDGGFSAQFLPALKFAPAAPPGYVWVYGQHGDDGSRYANLNYFCLAPTSGGGEGVIRGLYRGAGVFSRDQVFVNAGCGATASAPMPQNWNGAVRAVTMYVAYTPGVTR